MRLGFAVKVLGGGGLPSHDTRRWQSGPHLRVSLGYLNAILDYLEANDLHMYRMATALAPYASHPELTQFRRQVDDCPDDLAAVGQRARVARLRLSTHPGQYTVLNSTEPHVADAAVEELEVQGELFEAMGLADECVVVIHVGGGAGGTEAAVERFEKGFARLSERAQRRIVIENDDRAFDVVVCTHLAQRIGRPVVFDSLHHRCFNPSDVPEPEALQMCLSTWPSDVVPKVHFSSPRLDVEEKKIKKGRKMERRLVLPPLRAHADLVEPAAFERFLGIVGDRDVDVMLEAKAKDLALLRLRDQMSERGWTLG